MGKVIKLSDKLESLGWKALEGKKFGKAEQAFRVCLRCKSGDTSSFYGYACAADLQMNLEEAIVRYRAFLKREESLTPNRRSPFWAKKAQKRLEELEKITSS